MSHVCLHMCKHVVAEREGGIGNVEMHGVFIVMNPLDNFVLSVMRDFSCFRITGTTYRKGGAHYDSFLLYERRDGDWHRRSIDGWVKVPL